MALFNHARPIPVVIEDERTPPKTRQLLEEIPRMKAFGLEYGLDPTGNFEDYVQLDRAAASWVVTASDPLAFRPLQWSFPIVGSFTYLGWFDLDRAKKFAEGLREKGLDVDLRGARAYSTLGWFRDPVVSSMIADGDEALGDLVNTVLHESVHTTHYVNGQSTFNESLASFVADRITPLYLDRYYGRETQVAEAYHQSMEENARRLKVLHETYVELDRLYASDATAERKLAEKTRILEAVQKSLGSKRPINNALLIQMRTYGRGTAEFGVVLDQRCQGDFGCFWKRIRAIQAKDFARSQDEDFGALVLQAPEKGEGSRM